MSQGHLKIKVKQTVIVETACNKKHWINTTNQRKNLCYHSYYIDGIKTTTLNQFSNG